VAFNLLSVIDLPPDWKEYLGIRIRSVKDIYTVELRDVQVFVEKRRNVFNFHLLDDRLDIPNAEEVWRSLVGGSSSGGGIGGGREDRLDIPVPNFVDRSSSAASSMTVLASGGGSGAGTGAGTGAGSGGGGSQEDREEENALQAEDVKKADELVTSIVQAVSSLGRAANEGGTKGLSNALKNQKDGFVNHLRKVQNMVALGSSEKDGTTTLSSTTAAAAATTATTATTAAEQNSMIPSSNKEKKQNKSIGIAKEGIQVMKQVGKVVEKNVLNMKEQVDALSKPPPFRKDWKPMEYPDLFRFGYIVLKDARIFTKDIIIVPGADEKTSDKDEVSSCDFTSTSAKGWSKPIAIKEVRLFPSELCPPKDKENASTIGQPIEVYSNLALERVFTEMATSSISGKLLNNAFTDVFKLFDIANRAE